MPTSKSQMRACPFAIWLDIGIMTRLSMLAALAFAATNLSPALLSTAQ